VAISRPHFEQYFASLAFAYPHWLQNTGDIRNSFRFKRAARGHPKGNHKCSCYCKGSRSLVLPVVREDPERLVRDIGRRIAELRTGRGWTQQEFAARLGISVRYLARLERGVQNFTVHRLAWLANELGVRAIDLFAAPRSRQVNVGRPRHSRES
jgi:ribosome-binding protein aMBF1 (putative translation factor)